MKKILQWTMGLHLIFFGGFIPALFAGLTYPEFDQLKQGYADAQKFVDSLGDIGRLIFPWF